LQKKGGEIGAAIHCSGGGQTKVLKFTDPDVPVKIVKNNMFKIPLVFKLIQETGTPWKEMYRTFNMGHRLELYVDKSVVPFIENAFGDGHCMHVQVIGHVEASDDGKTEVIVRHQIAGDTGEFHYS
jgi:phosphoribosylformylglycinamidine cyclo-ligase